MTRGTLYYIDNEKAICSTEFNGSMYNDGGHGDDVLMGLAYDVQNEDDFRKFVSNFNEENFGYEEELIYDMGETMFDNTERTLIDFRNDYFGRFFSDYLFIKNNSDEDITIIDKDNNKEYEIPSGKTKRLNFGHVNIHFFKCDKDFDFNNRVKYLETEAA